MRTYALENRGRAPLYEYLYRCIRGDILDGTLTAGERLPSKRALAEHLQRGNGGGGLRPASGGGLPPLGAQAGLFCGGGGAAPACRPRSSGS